MISRAIGSNNWRRKTLPYLLLLPTVILLSAFTFYPFIRDIYITFFVTDSLGRIGTFVGFRNYAKVFSTPGFKESIIATFRFAALVGFGTLGLGLFFSALCIRELKGSKVYQTMFTLPIALASVPVASIALYFFGKYGIVNAVLGTDIMWLSNEATAIYCVAAVTVWAGVGTSFLFLLVGFRNVPDELIESATIDGAGSMTKLFKIYIPIASPQIFFVVFLSILNSFSEFGMIKILVGEGPNYSTNVLVYAMYTTAMQSARFERACVYALMLFLVIFVITRIQLFFEKKVVHYR